jgi:hypothetical protein
MLQSNQVRVSPQLRPALIPNELSPEVGDGSNRETTIAIDRDQVLEAVTDLERVPLPLDIEDCEKDRRGTTIALSALAKYRLAPREEPLREMLFYEYGRASGMQIIVNDAPLSFDDARGPTHNSTSTFDGSGDLQMRFSISDKRPRYAGFVIKVGGKAVGKPSFLGLEDDPEMPHWIRNRIFGEIDIPDLPDGHVTADWGAIFENSAPYQAIRSWARQCAREAMEKTYKRDFDLRKAHLKRDIDARLANMPEHRRAYAEAAVSKVLWKFYREHGDAALSDDDRGVAGGGGPSVRDLCTRTAPWLIRPPSDIGSGGSFWSMPRRSATCRPTPAPAIATCSSYCCPSPRSACARPWTSCP